MLALEHALHRELQLVTQAGEDCFFALIKTKAFLRGSFTSVKPLAQRILQFVTARYLN